MLDIDTDIEVMSVLRSAYILTYEVRNQGQLLEALSHLEDALNDFIQKYGDEYLK